MSVKNDKRIEASINRLRAMGLRCDIMQEGDNTAYIFIPLEDIIKLIRKRITYPTTKVYYEDGFIVIKAWRDYVWMRTLVI